MSLQKQITLKDHDQIQQVCKNHSAAHYRLAPEAIDNLGIMIDNSTIQAYTQSTYKDIQSFIKRVLSKNERRNVNNIST